MKTPAFGHIAVIAGFAVAVVGLGLYQAWWTIAFPIGGYAVAQFAQGHMSAGRAIALGAAISGSIVLAGMGLFLLYGSQIGPARPCDGCEDIRGLWLAGAIGALGTAIVLMLLVRRLVRGRPSA